MTQEIVEVSRIAIVSGWTNPGGSTVHFVELCNLLNDNGFDCTFYGPHDWHLDKCKSGHINQSNVSKDDILISHYITVKNTVAKSHILSCHETNMFPLQDMDLKKYDIIQFVSNSQKEWHSVNSPSIIIPPVVEKMKWKNPKNNTAGVVGSIDSHKQTHLSISKALEDGFSKVFLFGTINDPEYFNTAIMPWINTKDVVVAGHIDDKEEMYSQISTVYHSSKRETYGLVEAECKLAGIPFRGPKNNQDILDKDEILKRWTSILK